MLRTFQIDGGTIFERNTPEHDDQAARLTAASWIDTQDPTADERLALAEIAPYACFKYETWL